jgi:hypothetical protein
MKLGTQTASLINHIYSKSTPTIPTVGMGATVLQWTDRSAGTVISIEKNIASVQDDNYVRTDTNGMSDVQDYDFSPNLDGRVRNYRFNKRTDRWDEVSINKKTGRWIKNGSQSIIFGRRDHYYDFSF